MSIRVKVLFAEERFALKRLNDALQKQYGGNSYLNKRYDVQDHNEQTTAAREEHKRIFLSWHHQAIKAIAGNR